MGREVRYGCVQRAGECGNEPHAAQPAIFDRVADCQGLVLGLLQLTATCAGLQGFANAVLQAEEFFGAKDPR